MSCARHCAAALLAFGLAAGEAQGAEPEFQVAVEGHRFSPSEVTVPSGERIRLVVENRDVTPEEFESYALNREKIIAPGQKALIYVGPLKPGRYEFFGDFNPTTARGWLVAK
jgi:hypothetical protein